MSTTQKTLLEELRQGVDSAESQLRESLRLRDDDSYYQRKEADLVKRAAFAVKRLEDLRAMRADAAGSVVQWQGRIAEIRKQIKYEIHKQAIEKAKKLSEQIAALEQEVNA